MPLLPNTEYYNLKLRRCESLRSCDMVIVIFQNIYLIINQICKPVSYLFIYLFNFGHLVNF